MTKGEYILKSLFDDKGFIDECKDILKLLSRPSKKKVSK